MRNRSLWDAYVEGVIDYVNAPEVPETGMRTGPVEQEQAREQGRADAEDRRVMSRTEFSREKVLRRVEVRETEAAR